MPSLKNLPVGTIAEAQLHLKEYISKQFSESYLYVEDPAGTELKIYCSNDSRKSESSLQPSKWYEFQNLIHLPDHPEEYPKCPTCGEKLTVHDSVNDHALNLTHEQKTKYQFIIPDISNVTQTSSTKWITPIQDISADPITWSCSDCEEIWRFNNRQKSIETAEEADSLIERISAAVESSSKENIERNEEVQLPRRSNHPSRSLIGTDKTPNPDHFDFYSITSDYEIGPTNQEATRDDKISPEIQKSVTTNPITGEEECYCDINVSPGYATLDKFQSEVNLVFAIDISGSMSIPFERGAKAIDHSQCDPFKSKLNAVGEALSKLVQQLDENDSVGVVLFNTEGQVLRPLDSVTANSSDQLQTSLTSIKPNGSTNLLEGYRRARSLFRDKDITNSGDAENRLVLISDAMPKGLEQSIAGFSDSYQSHGIQTTFVGLGCPYSERVRSFCQVPGTNVAFVESQDKLQALFENQNGSILFPIGYNLTVQVDSPNLIESTTAASDTPKSGSLVHRQTVFPHGPTLQSLNSILLRLSRQAKNEPVNFEVSWSDRRGNSKKSTHQINLSNQPIDSFDVDSIRMRIAIHRYFRMLQSLCDVSNGIENSSDRVSIDIEGSQSELTGVQQLNNVRKIRDYLSEEIAATNNDDLQREIEILDSILKSG